LSIIKILSLAGLIVFGLAMAAKADIWHANWTNAWNPQSFDVKSAMWSPISGAALIGAISAAMVGSLFSSDAWNGVTFIAGEIKNPQRNGERLMDLFSVFIFVCLFDLNLPC